LIVNGPSTFIGNITEIGNLLVTGNTINNGATTFNGATIINGDTVRTGNTTQSGDVHITGNSINSGTSTFNGSSIFNGNVNQVGNLTITGTTVNNGLSVFNGNIAMIGNAVIAGNTTVTGTATLTGNSYITGNTFVTGTATLTGNSYITGNTFVTGPTTVTGNVTVTGNSIQTGQAAYIVSTNSMNQGAVEITGNSQGLSQPPVVPGVMLHITGQDNGTTPGRVYVDSMQQYSIIVGRRFDGTVANPTQVLAGEEIFRLAGTGYPTGGWPTTGVAQIRFIADENQTQTNRGGHLDFLTVPIGSNVVTQVMSLSATTGANVSGNLTAANVNATLHGNVVGSASNLTVNSSSTAGTFLTGKFTIAVNVGKNSLTTLTQTITGLTTNHKVVITPATAMPDTNSSFVAAWASASNTLSIQFATNSGGVNASFDISYFAWV
jgi:hypothetical protein